MIVCFDTIAALRALLVFFLCCVLLPVLYLCWYGQLQNRITACLETAVTTYSDSPEARKEAHVAVDECRRQSYLLIVLILYTRSRRVVWKKKIWAFKFADI